MGDLHPIHIFLWLRADVAHTDGRVAANNSTCDVRNITCFERNEFLEMLSQDLKCYGDREYRLIKGRVENPYCLQTS